MDKSVSRLKAKPAGRTSSSCGSYCCVPQCRNRQYLHDGTKTPYHFFSFPSCKEVQQRWCQLIRRQPGISGFKVTRHTRICHIHFKEDDIRVTLAGKWHRKHVTVEPCRFPWDNHDVKPDVKRASKKDVLCDQTEDIGKTGLEKGQPSGEDGQQHTETRQQTGQRSGERQREREANVIESLSKVDYAKQSKTEHKKEEEPEQLYPIKQAQCQHRESSVLPANTVFGTVIRENEDIEYVETECLNTPIIKYSETIDQDSRWEIPGKYDIDANLNYKIPVSTDVESFPRSQSSIVPELTPEVKVHESCEDRFRPNSTLTEQLKTSEPCCDTYSNNSSNHNIKMGQSTEKMEKQPTTRIFEKRTTRSRQVAESPDADRKRRKSERTQRMTVKPDFYSPSDYENPFKRRRARAISAPMTPTTSAPVKEEDNVPKKRKRGRPKGTPTKPSLKVKLKEESKNNTGDSGSTTSDKDSRDSRDKEEDMHSLVTPEKALQYAVILAEINNKFTSQVFRPT